MWWFFLTLLLGPLTSRSASEHPTLRGSAQPLSEEVRAAMTGVTWREGCPVGLGDLRLLTVPHHDMQGATQQGRLIVAADHAEALLDAFARIYAAGFPIARMQPAYVYGGSDDASMADDNTSAFNCRRITGGSSFSQHSYGHAVDINTVENPYVRGGRVLPPAGQPFADRALVRPGMITADGPVVAAFRDIGWRWGGHWRSLKDYQHFSANGR